MKNVTSLIAGILFSLGLGVSGMMNPNKVRAFLDITGVWDPALMFVMVGAILVYSVSFRLITKRAKPAWELNFSLPTKSDLDFKLIIGSALFGVGWGIAGVCPGPAIANLSTGLGSALIFVSVMVASIGAVKILERKK